MSQKTLGVCVVAAVMLSACGDSSNSPNASLILSSAFNSVPAGFDMVQSSFAGNAASDGTGGPGGPWMPHGRGPGGPGFGGGFMGGGMGPGFLGDIGPGRGFGHGPFGDGAASGVCTFSAATGDVTCNETRDGLTITRIATYKTSAGVAQSAPDSTTNSMRVRTSVSGSRTRRDSATSVLQHASDRTVTGLAAGSTLRTVNGAAAGNETTTGTNEKGAFTAVRVTGDTVSGLTVPVQDGHPTYPTAGTVTRVMKATVTVNGQAPTTTERREVITYNGSATATVVITQDGTSRTCSLPLPHGRPTCQ